MTKNFVLAALLSGAAAFSFAQAPATPTVPAQAPVATMPAAAPLPTVAATKPAKATKAVKKHGKKKTKKALKADSASK